MAKAPKKKSPAAKSKPPAKPKAKPAAKPKPPAKTPPQPAAPAAAPAKPRFVVETQTEVQDFFGVSFDTVKTWGRNGMPRAAKRYDLAEITRWILERRGRASSGAGPTANERRQQLEDRKLQAEVAKIEAANAATQGLLVDRRHVEAQVGQLLIELKKSFERLPARIQTALPRELEGTLLPEFKRLIHHTLHEVAQRMQEFCAPVKVPAAAEPPEGTGG